jgi:hypothetical protein
MITFDLCYCHYGILKITHREIRGYLYPLLNYIYTATKNEAIDQYGSITMESGTASIYMDGSSIGREVGVAAYQTQTQRNLQHLGSEAQYNIFAAELTAMCPSAK